MCVPMQVPLKDPSRTLSMQLMDSRKTQTFLACATPLACAEHFYQISSSVGIMLAPQPSLFLPSISSSPFIDLSIILNLILTTITTTTTTTTICSHTWTLPPTPPTICRLWPPQGLLPLLISSRLHATGQVKLEQHPVACKQP